jgi:hypothetical protein
MMCVVTIYPSSRRKSVISVRKKIEIVARNYLAVIKTSANNTARDGIAFADDAAHLCECLGQRHDICDVSLFISEMRSIAHRAHCDAKDTLKKFRAVRQQIIEVCIGNIISSHAIEANDRS